MMKTIVLKPKRDASVRKRHPWIFSGAIDETRSAAANVGEVVSVVDASGTCLGYGAFSPASQIRVRLFSFDARQVLDEAYVRELVRLSVARRGKFFSTHYTNAVRVINAESDGLPGVVADSYAGYIICQFTSAGAEAFKSVIVEALRETVPDFRAVAERNDLKDRLKEGLPIEPTFRVLAGEEPPADIEIFEGPCRFMVDVRQGHKTGFYLDQRDARRLVGSFAAGGEVLNCFSYTGGFGLFARAAGATQVTQVDISGDALARARLNESLMPNASTEMTYVEADVFKYLRSCRDAARQFDLIVLDPPKFAATKGQIMKAARGYKDINLLAMKLLKPNGYLATFSCSGAMVSDLFDKVIAEAALDAGCDFQIVARTRAGQDHPVSLSFPEGDYLKGLILQRR